MTTTAVVHERFGDIGALTLRTRDDEPLAAGQVRIAVSVAGLNPVDWQIVESAELSAMFGITVPSGFGNDFSGVIVEIGAEVTRWRLGDRVFGGARGAAVATTIVLEQDHRSLHRTPAQIDDLTAGVLDIAGRTASAVADALAVRTGETVLVGAAAGGVGSLLTQLLVHSGARVVGTGSASSFGDIRALGAEPVPYAPDLEESLRAAGISTIDAAADLHGTQTALAALNVGANPRRVVTIEAENPPPGVQAVNGGDARLSALKELLDLIADGTISVPIAAVYGLSEFAEAVAFQRNRHAHGKVAIEIALARTVGEPRTPRATGAA